MSKNWLVWALEGLKHVTGVAVTAAALCKAKQRQPHTLLQMHVQHSARTATMAPWLWQSLGLCLVDGTRAATPDTPELVHHRGKAQNQRGTSAGYPILKQLALVDYATGLLSKVISLPTLRQ